MAGTDGGRARRPLRRLARRAPAWLAAFGLAAPLVRAATDPSARDVFARHAPSVGQIEIQESESGTKRSIGSGFAVALHGLVVTNYHVVSEVIHHPERYRIRIRASDGEERDARLLAFDVVHDLAILRAEPGLPQQLRLEPRADGRLRVGERVFSLGHPFDLGLSVVEGTYNGLVRHSRYARLHFTGSLNPGMSGGPALLASGGVVGVNVATAGNQVSFLVPSAQIEALLGRVTAAGFTAPADPRGELREQLLAQQDAYLKEILASEPETVQLGSYRAPTRLAPFFNCWGDVDADDELLYEGRSHSCFTQDHVFVSERQSFSIVELHHRQLSSEQLGPQRFYALYSNDFEETHSRRWGRKSEFTPFRCHTGFVSNGSLVFKASFCARRYRNLPGLYDVVFKAAALGRRAEGMQSALVLSAVALEPARALARRTLESIRWVE